MSCDAFVGPNSSATGLRCIAQGCHSLHYQVYCITTFTRGRHLWMSDDDETPLVE